MERYGREIYRRLPPNRVQAITPKRPLYGLAGYVWEQTYLPRKIAWDDILWSPASSGPLLVPNQILTIHDLSVFDHPEWFSTRVRLTYAALLPRLARNVRHIVTDSAFSRDRILERFVVPPDRVSVIYPGVTAPLDQLSPHNATSNVSCDYVAAYGGSDPRKNVTRLVRAWRAVASELPDIRLKVFGQTSPVFSSTQQITDTDRIDNLGYLTDPQLMDLYRGTRAFVYPSLYEGFGLSPLEAISHGVPVVLSDIPVFREVFGNAARYVDPYDEDSIADGILDVLTNHPLRQTLAQAAKDLPSRYTWEGAAASLLTIAEECG